MTTSTDILRTACSAQTVIATPLGPLLLARTPSGLAGAWFEGQRHHPPQFDAPGNIVFVTLDSGISEAFINGTQPGGEESVTPAAGIEPLPPPVAPAAAAQ